MYNVSMTLTTIITETYTGSDRRAEPRRNKDRRKATVVVYDENGELSTKKGELVDIKI